jgi:hypothetical protein
MHEPKKRKKKEKIAKEKKNGVSWKEEQPPESRVVYNLDQ